MKSDYEYSAYMYGIHEHDHYSFRVGDKVRKVKGYSWPGVVVACFQTLSGQWRYVVECTVPEVAGALHIYNGEQLEVIE